MTNKKIQESVDFDVRMEVSNPRIEDDTKTIITVSYGNVSEQVDYPYPDNKPNAANEVNLNLPISGEINFGDDTQIDNSRWDVFNKNVKAVLTLMVKGIKFVYENITGISFTRNGNRNVQFSFDSLWEENRIDSKYFSLGATLSLSCEFTFPLRVDNVPRDGTFHITSNGNTGTEYYTSIKKDTVFVPMIQIYSEQHAEEPGELEYNLTVEEPISDSGNYQIVYGNPKTKPAANYTYQNNRPTEDNKVGVMVPLKGNLNFKQDRFRKAEVLGVESAALSLVGSNGFRIDHNLTESDKWYIITPEGFNFNFNIEDWKEQVNADTLNNQAQLSFTATIDLRLKIYESASQSETKIFQIIISDNPGQVTFGTTKTISPIKITAETAESPEEQLEYDFELTNSKIKMNEIIDVYYGSDVEGKICYPSNATDKGSNTAALKFPMTAKITFKKPCTVELQSGSKAKLEFNDKRLKKHAFENTKATLKQDAASGKKIYEVQFDENWGSTVNAWYLYEQKMQTFNAEFSLKVTQDSDGKQIIIPFKIFSSSNPTEKKVSNSPVIQMPFISIITENYRKILTLFTDQYEKDKKDKGRASSKNLKEDVVKELTNNDKKALIYIRGYFDYEKPNQEQISTAIRFKLREHKNNEIDTDWGDPVGTGFNRKNDVSHDIFIDSIKSNPKAYKGFTVEFSNFDLVYKE